MDTPCEVVAEYNTYTPLHVAQGLQIFFSVISIIVVVYTALRFLVTSIFEKVFKELLFFLYFLIFTHSLIIIILQGTMVIVRLTAADPCQAQISKLLCLSLRIATGLPIAGFVWIHLAITIQAMMILHLSPANGDIIYPTAIAYFTFRHESFEGRVAYCTGASASGVQTSLFNVFFLFALDVLDLVLDIALLKYNQYKLKFDKSFQMLVTFRRRQNVYSIQQFLPSAIFHCVCYMVQVFMVLYSRTFRGKVSDIEFNTINAFPYLIPYYCAIGPIILLVLMRKGRLIRKENLKNVVVPINDLTNDAHFSTLQQQWGVVVETQPVRASPSAPSVNEKK